MIIFFSSLLSAKMWLLIDLLDQNGLIKLQSQFFHGMRKLFQQSLHDFSSHSVLFYADSMERD